MTVATPGEWQCKTARSGEWAHHFSNASCFIRKHPEIEIICVIVLVFLFQFYFSSILDMSTL